MLGRLGMSVEEAHKDYLKFGKDIFNSPSWFRLFFKNEKFKSSTLEKRIKDILEREISGSEAVLHESGTAVNGRRTRTYVNAIFPLAVDRDCSDSQLCVRRRRPIPCVFYPPMASPPSKFFE